MFNLRYPQLLILTVAVSLILGRQFTANASVVTFDDTINTNANGFETQGFTFDIATVHYHLESSNVRYGMSSATTSLIIDDFAGANSLNVTNGTFSLNSLDIASQSASWGSTTVTIVGNLSGGGTVNYVYNDSDNSTFENIVLNWTNLDSVDFTGSGNGGSNHNWFRLDNIDATIESVVPEPTTFIVWSLLGLTSTSLLRRKRYL